MRSPSGQDDQPERDARVSPRAGVLRRRACSFVPSLMGHARVSGATRMYEWPAVYGNTAVPGAKTHGETASTPGVQSRTHRNSEGYSLVSDPCRPRLEW